ncbi:MAG: chemotaxis protein CheX [Blastocatellia bacterium]
MRLEFVRIFQNSIADMLRQVTDPDAELADLQMKPAPVTAGQVMVVIGLTGRVAGQVIFDMQEGTALGLASLMLEEPVATLTELSGSALAELASMTIGRGMSEINDSGFSMHMSPPVVLTGNAIQRAGGVLETLVVPVRTQYGIVSVNVSVQDLD